MRENEPGCGVLFGLRRRDSVGAAQGFENVTRALVPELVGQADAGELGVLIVERELAA